MKRTTFIFWLLVGVAIFSTNLSAQNLYISPASIPIGNFNLPVTVSIAGATPLNPLTNYTGQRVYYKWSFLGDGIYSNIYVKGTGIPTGFSYTVQASSTSSPSSYRPGTAEGSITLTTSYQTLVSGILSTARWWIGSAQTINRTLTQNIFISDFSQVRPGTYDILVEYLMQ
jgi:hypothetical protein